MRNGNDRDLEVLSVNYLAEVVVASYSVLRADFLCLFLVSVADTNEFEVCALRDGRKMVVSRLLSQPDYNCSQFHDYSSVFSVVKELFQIFPLM